MIVTILLLVFAPDGRDNLPRYFRYTCMTDDYDTAPVTIVDELRELRRELPGATITVCDWNVRERADIGY